MEESVNKYIAEEINTNLAVGEFKHPDPPRPTIDPDRVCVRHVEIVREGNDWIGKSLILDTIHGRQLRGLLSGGVRIGTSSKALAKRTVIEGVSQFQMGMKMCTIGDIVSDPSAPKAFVDGIMEGAEWIWQDGIYIESHLRHAEEIIKDTKSKDLNKMYAAVYRQLIR